MGNAIVVVVTTADHMCKKCKSLFTQMDKLDNYLKHVRNKMLSCKQKNHELLSPVQDGNNVEIKIVNKNKLHNMLL